MKDVVNVYARQGSSSTRVIVLAITVTSAYYFNTNNVTIASYSLSGLETTAVVTPL